MKDADRILRDALGLPPAERARIAALLLESLDELGPPGRCSEDELVAKLNDRIAEIDAGTAELIDAKQAIKEGRAELRRRRRR